jgi:hypothetical protein
MRELEMDNKSPVSVSGKRLPVCSSKRIVKCWDHFLTWYITYAPRRGGHPGAATYARVHPV